MAVNTGFNIVRGPEFLRQHLIHLVDLGSWRHQQGDDRRTNAAASVQMFQEALQTELFLVHSLRRRTGNFIWLGWVGLLITASPRDSAYIPRVHLLQGYTVDTAYFRSFQALMQELPQEP